MSQKRFSTIQGRIARLRDNLNFFMPQLSSEGLENFILKKRVKCSHRMNITELENNRSGNKILYNP